MKKPKKISSIYYDTDFNKVEKLIKRVEKLEIIKMELAAEREIRKKAEKHIEELINIMKKGE